MSNVSKTYIPTPYYHEHIAQKPAEQVQTPSATTFYVTTPIYYVNAKPHIGHLYSTLLADVIAKWQKLQGKQTFFVTGLDEHGQKVAQAAANANMEPQAFVDSMTPKFKAVWETFGISYDKFIRTTDKDHHTAVHKFLNILMAKNFIYKSSYQGFYCTPCETFITPHDVKTAQKETPANSEVLCTSCGRATQEISEESYFFKLSAFQDKLLEFYAQNPTFIQPKERLNEVISFVKSGLKDLSFSRKNVSWGIPFPGDPTHSVYVWGDALTNYLSAIGFASDEALFNKFWPADVHIMAKDIVKFHAIYWPAMLMAADLPLPKRELVHGYILQNNAKMSKSVGNVIDPMDLANAYGVEQLRFYLMRMISTTQDGSFSTQDIEDTVRADLANNLGNLLSRVCTLGLKNSCSEINAIDSDKLHPECKAVLDELLQSVDKIASEFDNYLMHHAMATILKQLANTNALIHKFEPWKLGKTDPELFRQILWTALTVLKVAGTTLWPVMPTKMEQLLQAIGAPINFGDNVIASLKGNLYTNDFVLSPLTEVLFAKPAEVVAEKPEITTPAPEAQPTEVFAEFEDFAKIKLAVGKIIEATALEKSDKLLKLSVDFGPLGIRQVVSGIAKHYQPADLIGIKAAFVVNLKPRKIMGLESQAMILCAGNQDRSQISTLTPGTESEAGDLIG